MRALPPPGGTLALDLSPSTIGFCHGPLTSKVPAAFGIWVLPKLGTEGTKYVAFVNVLYETIEVAKPVAIVLEASLSIQAMAEQANTRTANKILGMRAFVHECADRHSIPISEIDADTVRMETMGRCRWPKKGQAKLEVVIHCRQRLRLDVTDHNACDAILIWTWHRQRMMGIPPIGQLFPMRASA